MTTATSNSTTDPATTSGAINTIDAIDAIDASGAGRSPRSALRRTTLATAAIGAVATTAAAAALHAAGVSFAIDGEAIPLLGFAQMSFLWTLVGGVVAGSFRKRSAHPRLRFVQTTIVLTVLSCVPSVTAPASNGTRAALVATHLVAAAIAIPLLARRLDA